MGETREVGSMEIEREYVLGEGMVETARLNVDPSSLDEILRRKGLEKKPIEQDSSNSHISDNLRNKDSEANIQLVGKGEKRDIQCGQYFPLEFCSRCGKVNLVKHTCGSHGSRTCPNCWRSWREYHVESNMKKILMRDLGSAKKHNPDMPIKDLYHYVLRKRGYWYQQLRWIHGYISPAEGVVSRDLEGVKEGRSKAREIAERWGLDGFVLVFHGWRIEGEEDDQPNETWYDVRESDDWEEKTYWSPHWHVIGYVGRKDEESLLNDGSGLSGGWNSGYIKDVKSIDQLKKTLWYIFSHVGVDDKAKFQPIGRSKGLHWQSFNPKDELDLEVRQRIEKKVIHEVDEYKEHVMKKHGENYDSDRDSSICSNCGRIDFLPISRAKTWIRDHDTDYKKELLTANKWYVDGGIEGAPPRQYNPSICISEE